MHNAGKVRRRNHQNNAFEYHSRQPFVDQRMLDVIAEFSLSTTTDVIKELEKKCGIFRFIPSLESTI
jgi:hypothetical protein